jgi:hypothetical protein
MFLCTDREVLVVAAASASAVPVLNELPSLVAPKGYIYISDKIIIKFIISRM